MPIALGLIAALRAVTGAAWSRDDEESRLVYGTDALQRGVAADLVLIPGTVEEIAAIARLCDANLVPLVVRGAGTGYTGGAVPVRGGVVLSMERFDRILEIDEANQLAIVQPNVLTYQLQDAVEARGLFYPPDPASLKISALGGNVAECAGGPRAVKYGTTRHYVLALQAVLPSGEIIRTGSKAVKNVVGYDLTQLLVGSEGTLAILTEITLRLIPKPRTVATLQPRFTTYPRRGGRYGADRGQGRSGDNRDHRRRLAARGREAPAAKRSAAGYRRIADHRSGWRPGGRGRGAGPRRERVQRAGALSVQRASTEQERSALWEARRAMSFALRSAAPRKINHDVSVPRGRVPQLFALVGRLERELDLRDAQLWACRRRQHPRQHHGEPG